MDVSVDEWKKVANETEFDETDRKLLDLGDVLQIGLFKYEDEYFAVGAWCSHQRASLMEGDVEDHELTCPRHGARFDLRTGRQLSLPAVRPIASYPVKVEEGSIYIQV